MHLNRDRIGSFSTSNFVFRLQNLENLDFNLVLILTAFVGSDLRSGSDFGGGSGLGGLESISSSV